MPRPRALTAFVLAAGLVGCAGGSSGSLDPLADQADRVATLVEHGEQCRAIEAVRSLQTMADDDVEPAVRDAVTRFATSAQQGLVCDPAATPGASTTAPADTSPPPAIEDGGDDGGEDEGEDDGGGDDGDDGEDDGDDGNEGHGREHAPGQQDKPDRKGSNGRGRGGGGGDD